MIQEASGFIIGRDEKITAQSKSSITGLVATWLSIPLTLFIIFAFTYLPPYLEAVFSSAVKDRIIAELGVQTFAEVDLKGYIFDEVYRSIPNFLFVIICFFVGVLVLVWLVWCIVMTKRHLAYSLTVTDKRVLGRARGENLEAPLNKIVNVYVEQSLWGKLLHYGSLVLQTENKSLTFRNIHNPHHLHKLLMPFASNYCAR